MSDIVERLRAWIASPIRDSLTDEGRGYAREAADEIERLREALEFYETHGAGCRLIHSGGDPHRHALAADGGERARIALEAARKDGGSDGA